MENENELEALLEERTEMLVRFSRLPVGADREAALRRLKQIDAHPKVTAWRMRVYGG